MNPWEEKEEDQSHIFKPPELEHFQNTADTWTEVIEKELSGFCVADEISATHRGMMIAIPDEHWGCISGDGSIRNCGCPQNACPECSFSRIPKAPARAEKTAAKAEKLQ